MVTLANFVDFLGLGQEAQPATPAVGILVLTKSQALQNRPVSVPLKTLFDAPSGRYETTEEAEISESASFLPVAAVARVPGSGGNISSNSDWSSPQIGGLSVSNPAPFVGGSDLVPERKGIYPQRQKGLGPTDTRLQFCLNVGKALLTSIMGLGPDDTFPEDDPRVAEATFLLSLYRLENNLIQGQRYSKPSLHATSPEVEAYFRSSVWQPVLRQATFLVSHRIKYKEIIYDKEKKSA